MLAVFVEYLDVSSSYLLIDPIDDKSAKKKKGTMLVFDGMVLLKRQKDVYNIYYVYIYN